MKIKNIAVAVSALALSVAVAAPASAAKGGRTLDPDINGDDRVGCIDYTILTSYWLATPEPKERKTEMGRSDLNRDRVVNQEDLDILLAAWSGDSTTC